jgi:hypothetical protein
MRCNAAPRFVRVPQTTDHKNVDSRRPSTENALSWFCLESRFHAVLSKAAYKWPSVKSTPIEVPGTLTATGRESVRKAKKYQNGILPPDRHIMNEFTDKNEQAFLDACGAIGLEPDATVKAQKERYLVSEFLKTPVLWLETESLYHSYTTRGEAQGVADGIDRMISDGSGSSWPSIFARPSDTAFGS